MAGLFWVLACEAWRVESRRSVWLGLGRVHPGVSEDNLRHPTFLHRHCLARASKACGRESIAMCTRSTVVSFEGLRSRVGCDVYAFDYGT